MCWTGNLFGQDTLYVNDDSMGDISKYGARDSNFNDVKNKLIHLYGNAFVETEGINLTAGYILVDLNTNEITATYVLDEDGKMIETPVFKDGSEQIDAHTLKYNLNTKKAYIEEVKIKQDELILYMGTAKRHPNEEIHFKNGRFTTCDLEEPHYHFQLSRAVMVPDKRIVTGPMNLHIAGVPTPLGLPFSYIPQQEDRTHGLLFPELVPISAYGFGLNNLGYYFPINDRLQTSMYVSIYSRGSWGLKNMTEYAKRYGYSGSISASYYQFRDGFPTNNKLNNIELIWRHNKDAKSSPYWNFNTNVNFNSSNNTKNNLDPLNQNYFKNTLLSDININRLFPGKPIQLGMKISLNQNSTSKNISLNAPTINFRTSQFFPLKKFVRKPIFQRMGVQYSIEGQNRSTFQDTLLRDQRFDVIGGLFQNGLNQRISVQTTGGLFKNTLKITPSIAFGTKVNFQQIRRSYDDVADTLRIDTLQQAGISNDLSFNLSATTALYTYYKFIGKKDPIVRHVLTPSFGFSYIPAISTTMDGTIDSLGNTQEYSPFERSLYATRAAQDQGLITFNFANTFELKRISDKDTVTGFRKTRLIDGFGISGNYDLMKDTMKLSNISLNLRISPIQWFNITATSVFSPYGWVDSTNATIKDYAISSRGKLGRTLSNTVAFTLTLTSKESYEKIQENKTVVQENWQADYDYFYLHPERIVDFDIPWKVNFSYNLSMNRNVNKTIYNRNEFNEVQTVVVDGDLSFTKRWKLAATLNMDLKTLKFTNTTFTLNRDMHCWALSFRWTPVGFNKSFLLTIRNTSSLFKDAKLDFRKPPAFL